MDNEIIAKIPFVGVYPFGKWKPLFIKRYKPSTVILTKDRLIMKYLGFITVKNIPIELIKKVEVIRKKWITRGFVGDHIGSFSVYMDYALSITCDDSESDKIYLLAREERLKPLKDFLIN